MYMYLCVHCKSEGEKKYLYVLTNVMDIRITEKYMAGMRMRAKG